MTSWRRRTLAWESTSPS